MPTYKRVTSDTSPPVEGGGGGGGGGGGDSQFVYTFANTDWVIASPYATITVPESLHEMGLTPMVQVFEIVSFNLEKVGTEVILNGSGDVTIRVSFIPDLRFSGRIIIS